MCKIVLLMIGSNLYIINLRCFCFDLLCIIIELDLGTAFEIITNHYQLLSNGLNSD